MYRSTVDPIIEIKSKIMTQIKYIEQFKAYLLLLECVASIFSFPMLELDDMNVDRQIQASKIQKKMEILFEFRLFYSSRALVEF